MSLLGLIPLRYRIAAALLGATALVGALTAFYFHIEELGERKIEARVAAALAAQKAKDQKDIDNAQSSLATLQAKLDGAIHRHATAPISVRVCGGPASPGDQGQDAGTVAGSDGAVRPPRAVDQGPGASHDVTQTTLDILAVAGAKIAYLQGYIATCQKEGFCGASTSR